MAYLSTNDHVRLYYEDNEVTSEHAVILMHGFGGNHAEFINQVAYLTESGYRVISYDHRNHGLSDRTFQGLRVSRLAMDLNNLINELQLKSVDLIGHSMGASVIWAYLSLFGAEKIQHIVTIDQSPKALNTDDWAFGLLDDTWANVAFTARNVEHTKMTVKRLPDNAYQAIRAVQADHAFNYDQNEPLLLNHLVQDWRDVIHTYADVPQLFIAGGESPLWSCDYAKTCQYIANDQATVTVIPHTGHLPHVEDPDAVNAALATFL